MMISIVNNNEWGHVDFLYDMRGQSIPYYKVKCIPYMDMQGQYMILEDQVYSLYGHAGVIHSIVQDNDRCITGFI